MNGMVRLAPRFKDTLISITWIGGLVLIGGLSWYLTRPLRTNFLMNSIDQALISMGDSRRLEAAVNPENRGTFGPLNFGPLSTKGHWFSLRGEEDRLLFFTLISDVTFLPCAAILSPEGKVKEIIPLSSRGESALNYVSPVIVRLYIRRIEGGS